MTLSRIPTNKYRGPSIIWEHNIGNHRVASQLELTFRTFRAD